MLIIIMMMIILIIIMMMMIIITIVIIMITIIMIIIIIVIIVIALKGAIQDFTISSLRRGLSPTRTFRWPGPSRVKITCNIPSAYHMQHVVCHMVRRDTSAVKFDRV